jgi:sirohydrochlorin cobaltochelatase
MLSELLAGGKFWIGQVLVEEGVELRHAEDAGKEELKLFVDPEDAAEIVRWDDAGAYRPLKTAPNLRHGWRLRVADVAELRLALELIYPGRAGAFLAWKEGRLAVTPLRETLARQTGMYRITQKISDAQADGLVGRLCRTDGGCLRTILWRRDASGELPSSTLPAEKFEPRAEERRIPLLCQEACNLLVAEARAVVKGERASE